MSNVPKATIALVNQRDGESCVRCGVHGGNIHHRKLRSQAPKSEVHNVENLITLCGSGTTGCHGWVHANPRLSYEYGWMVRSWQDPAEAPVFYNDGTAWILTDRGTRIAS